MSLHIFPAVPVRKRRRRRQQIPTLAVTEGRVLPVPLATTPSRRIGRGGETKAERLAVCLRQIERMDAEGCPRWEIAAATGLKLRQVYYHLAALRERRAAEREVRRVIDDLAIPD
jgi:hypothetical protein